MKLKPRLFVGTSSENVSKVGGAIQSNLDSTAHVKLWSQGIFELTGATLRSLLKALDIYAEGVPSRSPGSRSAPRDIKAAQRSYPEATVLGINPSC